MTQQAAGPSPERIFQTLVAFQQAAALGAALDLDVFSPIGAGANSVPAIAAATKASERGVRILCDYLTILGFLAKDNSVYTLTPDAAAFLDRHSPAYMGGMRHFLQGPVIVASFQNLTAAVRSGTTQLGGQGSVSHDHPMWVEFAHSMTALMAPAADGIAKMLSAKPPGRVLDIAAGHGLFGIEIAKQHPGAEITAVDWPAVLAVAQDNAEAAGVSRRFSRLGGDAFEVDFGVGYDVALLTNFLHHFDPPTCETLLRKVHAALKPGGQAITLEMLPNEDRVSPPMAAAFSLMMLATTPSGDAYTFAEYERMFQSAGFAHNETRTLPMSPQTAIVSTRD